MHYIFKTFNVGSGDCMILLLQNDDKELHIMVDCGYFTKEVNDYITQTFGKRIDYLIVTHIDNDHICGLISMLDKIKDLTIHHILYNCYQRTSEDLKDWDEKMKDNVKRLYGDLPAVVDMLEGKINAKTSIPLAELILENDHWKQAWRREYVTSGSEPIELGNDMGKLIFLSPNQDALDKLDNKYRMLFWKKIYKKKDADYNKEESIYEALMRIVEDGEEETDEPVSATLLDEKTLKAYADKSVLPLTDVNEASIAFVWECKEHRILFFGDASPKIVSENLENVYADLPKPIVFDAIKVSHHGSAHSTIREQFKVADSELYFVTGGAKVRPSFQALSRIVTAPMSGNINHREIRYNRQNEILQTLNEAEELKEKFHYSIEANKNEYELSD